jgi:hypothetical protein
MDSYLAREGILVKNGAGLVLFYCSMLWARDLTVSGEIISLHSERALLALLAMCG